MNTEALTQTENLEDFIKVSFASNDISERCANEILRLTSQLKDSLIIPTTNNRKI